MYPYLYINARIDWKSHLQLWEVHTTQGFICPDCRLLLNCFVSSAPMFYRNKKKEKLVAGQISNLWPAHLMINFFPT